MGALENKYRFRDMTGMDISCASCKYRWHSILHELEMPCDACCMAHCAYELDERMIPSMPEAIKKIVMDKLYERRTG